MNCIENMWSSLKCAITKHMPDPENMVTRFCVLSEEWDAIPEDMIRAHTSSMRRRIDRFWRLKWSHSKWWFFSNDTIVCGIFWLQIFHVSIKSCTAPEYDWLLFFLDSFQLFITFFYLGFSINWNITLSGTRNFRCVGNCHFFVTILIFCKRRNYWDSDNWFSYIEGLMHCHWFGVQYDIYLFLKRPVIFCWKSCVFNDHDCRNIDNKNNTQHFF